MWVKICANTNLHDAQMAVDAGADAVGFVFAPSPRLVTVEQVRAISAALSGVIEKVGVFTSDDAGEIARTVRAAGLTAVQLHRPFDAEMVTRLSKESGGNWKIIQTVAYAVDSSDAAPAEAAFVTAVRAAALHPAVWAVLIDAAKSGTSGGLGVAFDWAHVGRLLRQAIAASEGVRIILAGGLRPENVAEAIAEFAPWGVDVASGVEVEVGVKSEAKLRAFIANASAAA